MSKCLLSVVIPTFNRREMLPNAVESALAWLRHAGSGEVVIVDDGSNDGTAAMVRERYADQLADGILVFHEHEKNGGAAAAKNTGARIAKGEWIVFLDSDDELRGEAIDSVLLELHEAGAAPAVFFRCVEKSNGKLVGDPLSRSISVDLRKVVSEWRWAECLPIVRAEAARHYPYVVELPGCEGISYARMARDIGPLVVTPIVARIYDTGDHDRVTTMGRLARSGRQKEYTSLVLREFSGALSLRTRLIYVASNLRARFESAIARVVPQRA